MIKVYIASPYTLGDVAVNVKIQIDAANKLMNKGFAPFAPLYSHFQHMVHPRPYQDWINIDLEWLKVCDCVLRLDGESSGADGEVNLAKELNIPVYYSLDELYAACVLNALHEKQEDMFVCGHPPKQTYLIDGIWHCEKCGGKWESIANK